MRIRSLGIVLLLAPLPLLAPFETAEVLGTVTDNSGQVVSLKRASVSITPWAESSAASGQPNIAQDFGTVALP